MSLFRSEPALSHGEQMRNSRRRYRRIENDTHVFEQDQPFRFYEGQILLRSQGVPKDPA